MIVPMFAHAELISPPAPGELKISEVYANADTGEQEWIELHSLILEPRDVSGFTISDDVGIIYRIPNGTLIQSGEFLVISGWSNKLNNTKKPSPNPTGSADSAILKDATGNTIDSVMDFPPMAKHQSWYPWRNGLGNPTPGQPEAGEIDEQPEETPVETPPDDGGATGDGTSPTPDPESGDDGGHQPTPTPTPIVESPSPTPIPTPPPDPLPQGGDVIISEIVSNPLNGEAEWIEFRSKADHLISLTGCTISDATAVIYHFPENVRLAPGEMLVVKGWGNKLNNTGDSVFFALPGGGVLDQVIDFPALEQGESWLPALEKKGLPTPGEENILLENPDEVLPPEDGSDENIRFAEAGEVIISEIMSNPSEGEEWIELQSKIEESVSLAGFSFHDNAGKFFEIPAGTMILPGQHLVLTGWTDKLNNDGDSVNLLGRIGEMIDTVVDFPEVTKGKSWCPEFGLETDPSPGGENILPKPDDENDSGSLPIPEIRINELFPSPENQAQEWIELASFAFEAIDISGMTIADATGDFFTFPVGTTLVPGQLIIASGWNNKLNNSGDNIALKTADGNIVQKISYPSVSSGSSWGFDGSGYRKSDVPTPGLENIFPIESGGGGGGGGASTDKKEKKTVPKLVKTKALVKSAKKDGFDLLISEVAFAGEADFIELYCAKCDLDLGGVRIADDDVLFEFPANTFVKSGEFIVIYFAADTHEVGHINGVWNFRSSRKGLTATDETVFVLDSSDSVEDALCIADQNGKFSPGEEEDVVLLIKNNALYAEHPLTEAWCFDSRKLKKGASLSLSREKIGNAARDYFASEVPTPGFINSAAPLRADDVRLSLRKVVHILPELAIAEIYNEGETAVNTQGFALAINGEGVKLDASLLHHLQAIFVLLKIPADENISGIELHDGWGQVEDSWNESMSVPFPGNPSLSISEILANPEGKDTGDEFVELRCAQDVCPANSYLLRINNKVRLVPEKKLHLGAYFVSADLLVPNTDVTVEIIDLERNLKETIMLDSVKNAQSYAEKDGAFYWTSLPTPEQENIIIDNKVGSDTDKDGIRDQTEILLGSNPNIFDAENSTAHSLYRSYVSHATQITSFEADGAIVLSGKTVPNADIKIVLHSELKIFETQSDKKGRFSTSVFPDIEPGLHRIDLIVREQNNRILVIPEKNTISISKNPRADWLSNIAIFRVLPNPTGKDAGKEIVVLENKENRSGWLKQAVLSNGKTVVSLPDIYFGKGAKHFFTGKTVPALLNKNGQLILIDVDGRAIDSLSWKSAKAGAMYWHGMPAEQAAKKRVRKGKLKKRSAPITKGVVLKPTLAYEDIIFIGISNGFFHVQQTSGDIVSLQIDASLSEALLQSVLTPGEKIRIGTIGNVVSEVALVPPKLIAAVVSPHKHILLFLLLSFCICTLLASAERIAAKIRWLKLREILGIESENLP